MLPRPIQFFSFRRVERTHSLASDFFEKLIDDPLRLVAPFDAFSRLFQLPFAQNLRDDAVGSVWLDGGRLVHADSPKGALGEDACREMLGWNRSLFRFVENTVPMRTTITAPWQHVLMEAARLADESGSSAQAG